MLPAHEGESSGDWAFLYDHILLVTLKQLENQPKKNLANRFHKKLANPFLKKLANQLQRSYLTNQRLRIIDQSASEFIEQ
jgi:hypothetical protein